MPASAYSALKLKLFEENSCFVLLDHVLGTGGRRRLPSPVERANGFFREEAWEVESLFPTESSYPNMSHFITWRFPKVVF